MLGDGRAPESQVRLSDILDVHRDLMGAMGAVESRLRSEMQSGHTTLTGQISDLVKAHRDAAILHEQEHIKTDQQWAQAKARYDAWLDREELNEAVKGRILAGFRYVVNTVGPHWRFLGILLAGLAALLGNVKIDLDVIR